MLARFCALLAWALVALSVVFWGLRLLTRAPAAPAYAVAVDNSTVVRGDLTRLLGAPPPPSVAPAVVVPEAQSRFRLLGIMAPRLTAADRSGVALISVDGKPPRAFTVGASLDDTLVLQSVSLRAASIGPASGPAALTLDMPALPTAATGSLAPVGGAPVPAARFVPPGMPVQNPAPPMTPPQFAPGGPPPGSRNDVTVQTQ